MKIIIETIPHTQQRYPTVGDWYFQGPNGEAREGNLATDTLVIRVSDLANWKEELCVALHELVEVAAAHAKGITVAQVDAFDMAFEQDRELRLKSASTQSDKDVILMDEPGDDPLCPIKREHSIATGIERILAAELGVDWHPYELKIEHL